MSATTIVVVTGGRDYAVADVVFRALDDMNGNVRHTPTPAFGGLIRHVYHGACGLRGEANWKRDGWREKLRGADGLAERWCVSRQVPSFAFPAFWDDLRLGAGPTRNGWMLGAAKTAAAASGLDLLLLAFPGGDGTHDCVKQAKRFGIGLIDLRETS